jgi:hypothetical protein
MALIGAMGLRIKYWKHCIAREERRKTLTSGVLQTCRGME